jgi:predicted RNA-binding Zn ribbon-like protein
VAASFFLHKNYFLGLVYNDTILYGVVMSPATIPAGDLYSFRFRGGRPSLNLVATVGWRDSENPIERLRDTTCLAQWIVAAGLLNHKPAITEVDLCEARELREAIYQVANSVILRTPPAEPDIRIINRFAAHPVQIPQLSSAGKELSLSVEQDTAVIPSILSEIARDAIQLLGSPSRTRIKRCARPDCTLLFVDESRSGRRRWCSMLACGNRAKTVSYRRNLSHKATATQTTRKGTTK